jgi:acetyltransferase
MNLKEFFNPRSIAVIGASSNPEKVGYALMNKLKDYNGKLIPINPNNPEIFGIKSFGSVLDYPKKIELAIIAIPAEGVNQILEECGKKKIKNAIVISAGFSERGNKELENKIAETAKKHKINLLGPNCFGIANPYLNLDATFANSSAKKGDIAFISQSGALWSYIADISESKNIGFSGFVSLGNMADISFHEFIEYFSDDPKTEKIILYIEKLKDGKEFIKVCKASKKQIIAIKAGRSKEGKEATISHTGSLATDFEIYKGAFRQANVILADSFASAFGFKAEPLEPKKGSIAIITNAGGAGALVTDHLVEKGFSVENPIDIIGTATSRDYESALNNSNWKRYSSIIVILTPQTMSDPKSTAQVIASFKDKDKITALFLGEKSMKEAEKIFKENNIKYIKSI